MYIVIKINYINYMKRIAIANILLFLFIIITIL